MHKSPTPSKTTTKDSKSKSKQPKAIGYGMRKVRNKELWQLPDGTRYAHMTKQLPNLSKEPEAEPTKLYTISTTFIRVSLRACEERERPTLHNNSVRRRLAKQGITSTTTK